MSRNVIHLILVFFAMASVFAADDKDAEQQDLGGVYEVTRATLNEKSCDDIGKTIQYASKYLSVTQRKSNSYNIAICNGESLDELDCVGGYQSTNLEEAVSDGWQGYNYTARKAKAADKSPICRLYASRRKIIPMGSGFLRYERSDWTETLKDFIAECDRPMAKIYSDAQSLKCTTHIVLFGTRVADSLVSTQQ